MSGSKLVAATARLEIAQRELEEAIREARGEEPRGLAGAALGSENLAQTKTCAPVPWVEASIEEKVERTREQVKVLLAHIGQLFRRMEQVDELRADLAEHRHNLADGGTVMFPADRRKRLHGGDECCNGAQEVDPSKLYF